MRLHPGETEAAGWRVMTVLDAVRQLRDASPDVTGRPRIIAIDGRGGAGKTTLAERLRKVVPNSAIVHTDDIAWNHAYFDWGAVLIENILQPLHRGTAVDFRPDAWIAHDRPGSITLPPAPTSSGSRAPASSVRSLPRGWTPRCGCRVTSMSKNACWSSATVTLSSSWSTWRTGCWRNCRSSCENSHGPEPP
ncbi:hypothetical protein ACFQX6_36590 [Streptosporangium lutulentum]